MSGLSVTNQPCVNIPEGGLHVWSLLSLIIGYFYTILGFFCVQSHVADPRLRVWSQIRCRFLPLDFNGGNKNPDYCKEKSVFYTKQALQVCAKSSKAGVFFTVRTSDRPPRVRWYLIKTKRLSLIKQLFSVIKLANPVTNWMAKLVNWWTSPWWELYRNWYKETWGSCL